MTSGEIMALTTVAGTLLGFLGVTVDPQILQNGLAGIVSFAFLCAALWSWYKHHTAIS